MVKPYQRFRLSTGLCDNMRIVPFSIFVLGGLVGVLLDIDHVLYQNRQFHDAALIVGIIGAIVGFIGALSSRYMGGILTEKHVCKFCGDRLINTGSEGSEKRSCPRCKAIIWVNQDRQPRCPTCGEKAWKVEISEDGGSLCFIHVIKESNEGIENFGHSIRMDEL